MFDSIKKTRAWPWIESTLTRLRALKPGTRVRGWVFSFVFGLIVISAFYALKLLIPTSVPYYNELTTFLFIIIAVLLLFPAREWIARRLLQKTEYYSFKGEDFHHLDFIARQFTMDTLIHEITPELMDWLRVRSAKLVILEPDRRRFLCQIYHNGRIFQDRMIPYGNIENRKKFLMEHRKPLFYSDPDLPPNVRAMMEEFRASVQQPFASVLQPFIYRNRLLGFLLLNEEPRHKYAAIGLETFAGKAAVSIQNYILSSKVIDSQQLEQEFKEAAKIQRLLQLTKEPKLPGHRIKFLENDGCPRILEFFQSGDRWFLVALCSLRLRAAAGLFLFGILGRLYSFIHRKKDINLRRIMGHLKKDPDLIRSEYRMDILVAEIEPEKRSMTIMADGKDFHIREVLVSEKNLLSPGWRNFIELKPESPLRILHAGDPLLEIVAREGAIEPAVAEPQKPPLWQLN